MWATVRALGASLQIALAAGYVVWVSLPGRAHSGSGPAWWTLALAVVAIAREVAWRRGHQGDVSSVARVAGLLTLGVALSLFVATLGIQAMVPSLDF